ncbi:MAG TPA: 50S ribosomal protein L13, partial [Lachnospiraceae bacterium]|nr:50S ribosomal protein L13 [Lachnospiraceae bacterium]
MKTYIPSAKSIERKWYVVDATDKTLGRLASEVATVLRGKNKPIYTPFLDCGDYVIVINAEKIKVTGKKMEQKLYFRHSAYIGGNAWHLTTLREALAKKPVWV